LKEVLDSRFLITSPKTRRRSRGPARSWPRSGRGAAEFSHGRGRGGLNTVCQKAGHDEARSRFRSLEHAGLEFVPLDPSLAREAGLIKCAHRDIPTSDCIIAATALRLGALVVSDDPHFSKIRGLRTTWI